MKTYRRTRQKTVDGDTFKVQKPIKGKQYVRLANVNAPEKHQFGGERATRMLSDMIGGRRVTIKPVDVGRRVIAEVVADRKSVNQRMRDRL